MDFGLSNTYSDGETLQTACGSPCYAAPEMIAGLRYFGSNVDVWSCGVIMFALVCGYLPFEDPNTTNLYQKILKGKIKFPSSFNSNAKSLVKHLLEADLSKRYGNLKGGVDDIKNHRLFKGLDWNALVSLQIKPPYLPKVS